MASTIEHAKSILAKGIKLGDEELIALANSMLDDIQELSPDVDNYSCTNCKYTFTSEKVRKSCPKCKKRKLEKVIQTAVKQVVKPNKKKDSGSVLQQGVNFINPNANANSGNKKYGRIEAIGPFRNTFVDDGSVPIEELDRKKPCPSSPRERGPSEKIQVRCEFCGRTYLESKDIVSPTYYVCSKCVGK